MDNRSQTASTSAKGHIRPLLYIHFVYNPFKNVKMILSSRVIQMQATGQIWSRDHSLPALGIDGQGQGSVEGHIWWAVTFIPLQPSWVRMAALAFRNNRGLVISAPAAALGPSLPG